MGYDKDRLLILLERYEQGVATSEELQELTEWYDAFDEQPLEISAATQKRLGQHLFQRIAVHTGIRRTAVGKRRRMVYAMTGVGCLAILSIALWTSYRNDTMRSHGLPTAVNDLMPGRDRATFKMGNHATIDLDSLANGQEIIKDGAIIKKTDSGTIRYQAASELSLADKTPEINTISTPNGGKYVVVLPDGSSVWLNAASSVSFPTHFAADGRTVMLSGEAFFSVTPRRGEKGEPIPFTVKTADYTVNVYGTSFNVSAYDGEDVTTTLVSGKVGIALPSTERGSPDNEYVLLPGQQAMRGQHGLDIVEVNVANAIAWKNGFFFFDGTDLHTLLKQAARWYDIETVIDSNRQNALFYGKIPRDYTLNEFMKVLELSKTKYRIERVTNDEKPKNRLVFLE